MRVFQSEVILTFTIKSEILYIYCIKSDIFGEKMVKKLRLKDVYSMLLKMRREINRLKAEINALKGLYELLESLVSV